jgi:hypothetical protein
MLHKSLLLASDLGIQEVRDPISIKFIEKSRGAKRLLMKVHCQFFNFESGSSTIRLASLIRHLIEFLAFQFLTLTT